MTTLYISQKAWQRIEKAVRADASLETGGILMGYALKNDNWLITFASGPGPKAVQARNAVIFDDSYHRKIARKASLISFGRWSYLGDWHSHTIRRLSPSRMDRQTVMSKTVQAKYSSSSPLMLIVGLDKRRQLHARGFVYHDSLREVNQIELVNRLTPQLLEQIAVSPDAKK